MDVTFATLCDPYTAYCTSQVLQDEQCTHAFAAAAIIIGFINDTAHASSNWYYPSLGLPCGSSFVNQDNHISCFVPDDNGYCTTTFPSTLGPMQEYLYIQLGGLSGRTVSRRNFGYGSYSPFTGMYTSAQWGPSNVSLEMELSLLDSSQCDVLPDEIYATSTILLTRSRIIHQVCDMATTALYTGVHMNWESDPRLNINTSYTTQAVELGGVASMCGTMPACIPSGTAPYTFPTPPTPRDGNGAALAVLLVTLFSSTGISWVILGWLRAFTGHSTGD